MLGKAKRGYPLKDCKSFYEKIGCRGSLALWKDKVALAAMTRCQRENKPG